MKELSPCPFCGSQKITVYYELNDIGDYQVQCDECGAETRPEGFRYTREEALKDWNQRT